MPKEPLLKRVKETLNRNRAGITRGVATGLIIAGLAHGLANTPANLYPAHESMPRMTSSFRTEDVRRTPKDEERAKKEFEEQVKKEQERIRREKMIKRK